MKHLTLWIAFWIFTLSGGFPTGQWTMDDLDTDELQKNLKCKDSTFYTPSKVEVDCITAALECFRTELKGTVHDECSDPKNQIGGVVKFLDSRIEERSRNVNGAAPTKSTECPCERWPTTNITNFFNAMESLLEQIQSEALTQ